MLMPYVLASVALAAPLDAPTGSSVEDDSSTVSGTGVAAPTVRTRKAVFELNFRVRRLILPSGILTLAGFEDDTERYDWPLRPTSTYCQSTPDSRACGTVRPSISAMSYGVELLAKFGRDSVIFYFDYADSEMPAGYWDDREDLGERDDTDDGDFLAPGPDFGAVVVGVNYQADIALVKSSRTRGAFGMDLTAGAGLGVILLVGEMKRWEGQIAETPSYDQFDRSSEPRPDSEFGRLWPAVDVNLGLRFTFAERAVVRIEGGLHTLLYFGGSVGFRF